MCKVVADCGSNYFCEPIWRIGMDGLLLSGQEFSIDARHAHMFALHWYAIYSVFNSLRHAPGSCVPSLHSAVLKKLAVNHEFSRKVIVECREGSIRSI